MKRIIELLIITTIVLLMFCKCNGTHELGFIETGYSFEHIDGYHPDRYFSKDPLSFNDYQNIVNKYTEVFGKPTFSGERDEAIRNYNCVDIHYEGLPHVWSYATDGEYYTIFEHESVYLLILLSNHCGIFIFK